MFKLRNQSRTERKRHVKNGMFWNITTLKIRLLNDSVPQANTLYVVYIIFCSHDNHYCNFIMLFSKGVVFTGYNTTNKTSIVGNPILYMSPCHFVICAHLRLVLGVRICGKTH